MTPQEVSDITPAGSAAPILSSPGTRAYHIVLVGAGNTCRFGDAQINGTSGAKLPSGVPVVLRCDFEQGGWDLNELYVFASGSDSISVTYGA